MGGGTVKCLQILDNDNFDVLYSILYYIEEMSANVRKDLLDTLNKSLRYLLKGMEKEHILTNDSAFEHRKSLQSGVTARGAGTNDLNVYRNCLKAYTYLISWFLQDNSKLKETKDTNAQTKARNKKGPVVPGSVIKKSAAVEQS